MFFSCEIVAAMQRSATLVYCGILLIVMGHLSSVASARLVEEAAAPPPPLDDDDLTAALTLRNVMLFQRGALMTSLSTHVWSAVGQHTVRMNLPDAMLGSHSSDGLQLQLRPSLFSEVRTPTTTAPGAIVLRYKTDQAVDRRVQLQIEHVSGNISTLRRELLVLSDDLQLIADGDRWMEEVVRTVVTTQRQATPLFPSSEMLDVVDRLGERRKSSKKATRDLREKSDELHKKIQQLNEQLSTLQRSLTTRVLLVTVQVDVPGTFELEVKRVTPFASWSPSYDLSLNTTTAEGKPLSLHYFANIHQNTGVDWEDVEIQLSTGSVRRHHEPIPVLQPWRLGFSPGIGEHPHHHAGPSASQTKSGQGRFTRGKATPSVMAHQTFGAVAGDAAQEEVESFASLRVEGEAAGGSPLHDEEPPSSTPRPSSDFVELVQSGVSDVFVLKGRHTIRNEASAANAVRAAIAELRFAVNMTAVVYPRYSSSAFLRAEFENVSPVSLLAGPGQAFVDGALLGEVQVPFTGRLGSRCVVDLGLDRAIEVTRQLSRAATLDTTSGIFSTTKYRSVSRNVMIVVENKRHVAVDVLVRELVPQPSHSSIHVTLQQPPLDRPLEDVLKEIEGSNELVKQLGDNATLVRYPGMVEWKRNISPSTKSTIFLRYTASWPRERGDRHVNVDL